LRELQNDANQYAKLLWEREQSAGHAYSSHPQVQKATVFLQKPELGCLVVPNIDRNGKEPQVSKPDLPFLVGTIHVYLNINTP
jgi:hypothetical protein